MKEIFWLKVMELIKVQLLQLFLEIKIIRQTINLLKPDDFNF